MGVFGPASPLLDPLEPPGNKRLTIDFRRFLFLGAAAGASGSGICSNNSLLDLVSLSSGNCKRGMMRGEGGGSIVSGGTIEAAATIASTLPPLLPTLR